MLTAVASFIFVLFSIAVGILVGLVTGNFVVWTARKIEDKAGECLAHLWVLAWVILFAFVFFHSIRSLAHGL